MPCDFSYNHYEQIIQLARTKYEIVTLQEYSRSRRDRVLILRHDIDANPQRAVGIAKLEHDLGVESTYFVRVHAEMYNPFGFRTYPSLKRITQLGHEIGLHYENLDLSHITGEDAQSILKKEIQTLQTILGIKIAGMSAHRGFSGIANRNFWKNLDPSQFGLEYEAQELTKDCLFVSDSLTNWPRTGGECVCKVLPKDNPRICLLTHPQFWYKTAYYLE